MPIPSAHHDGAGQGSIGLLLTGGGARAAYQVGVLSGILNILDPDRRPGFKNPFPIICGTSAGAINATAYSCGSDAPHRALDGLHQMWEGLHTEMVYKADAPGLFLTALRWFGMLAVGWLAPRLRNRHPRSLLDNDPLRRLLATTLDFERLNANFGHDRLESLAITAVAYMTGEHLVFYQSKRTIEPWQRKLRRAVPCSIGIDHLLASSSIPFIFPAQAMRLQGKVEWCGDGSMRQLAPLSPVIHLGARKVLVIGTGHQDDVHEDYRTTESKYPTLAQIGGHVLSNIFLDSLSSDVERLGRLNDLIAQLPPDARQSQVLRHVTSLVIRPSRSLDDMAMEHLSKMPRAARTLFRALGVSSGTSPITGGQLISYLLFESSYTQELIKLGLTDSMSRVEEVKAFFKETP